MQLPLNLRINNAAVLGSVLVQLPAYKLSGVYIIFILQQCVPSSSFLQPVYVHHLPSYNSVCTSSSFLQQCIYVIFLLRLRCSVIFLLTAVYVSSSFLQQCMSSSSFLQQCIRHLPSYSSVQYAMSFFLQLNYIRHIFLLTTVYVCHLRYANDGVSLVNLSTDFLETSFSGSGDREYRIPR
ncbi:hypothetical protein STEG23_032315, partial [Scotinomys teguina]